MVELARNILQESCQTKCVSSSLHRYLPSSASTSLPSFISLHNFLSSFPSTYIITPSILFPLFTFLPLLQLPVLFSLSLPTYFPLSISQCRFSSHSSFPHHFSVLIHPLPSRNRDSREIPLVTACFSLTIQPRVAAPLLYTAKDNVTSFRF